MSDSRRDPLRVSAKAKSTPFQRELLRLIGVHSGAIPDMSGRGLSAALGKSGNHLWLILNRGMVPSGPATLDIVRLLKLSDIERDGLILAGIETKAQLRSRDKFWINEVHRLVRGRDADLNAFRAFLTERGLMDAFESYRAAAGDRAGEAKPIDGGKPRSHEGPAAAG